MSDEHSVQENSIRLNIRNPESTKHRRGKKYIFRSLFVKVTKSQIITIILFILGVLMKRISFL